MSHLNTYNILVKKTWYECWKKVTGEESGMNTEKRRWRDIPFCHKLELPVYLVLIFEISSKNFSFFWPPFTLIL